MSRKTHANQDLISLKEKSIKKFFLVGRFIFLLPYIKENFLDTGVVYQIFHVFCLINKEKHTLASNA